MHSVVMMMMMMSSFIVVHDSINLGRGGGGEMERSHDNLKKKKTHGTKSFREQVVF